jgi:hypothetical protein
MGEQEAWPADAVLPRAHPCSRRRAHPPFQSCRGRLHARPARPTVPRVSSPPVSWHRGALGCGTQAVSRPRLRRTACCGGAAGRAASAGRGGHATAVPSEAFACEPALAWRGGAAVRSARGPSARGHATRASRGVWPARHGTRSARRATSLGHCTQAPGLRTRACGATGVPRTPREVEATAPRHAFPHPQPRTAPPVCLPACVPSMPSGLKDLFKWRL